MDYNNMSTMMASSRVENGLQSSMWAPGNRNISNPSTPYTPRPGDWKCFRCNYSNYANRDSCLRCTRSKYDIVNGVIGGSVPNRSRENNPLRVSGQSDSLSRPFPYTTVGNNEGGNSANTRLHSGNCGLSTSRWAPRGAYRTASNGGTSSPLVWTRTVPISRSISDSLATPHAHPSPTSPDLGLPYEVQHYILTMMERFLEEACFKFATLWIPQVLQARNFTCYEAVELAEWKRLLPEHIPSHALHPVPNYTLLQGLTDAVRVRNSAQHRHLCDNFEIRKMAKQSQDLMTIFGDKNRECKFSYLRDELVEWDNLGREDQQAARNRLKFVLQQISERPVSDMDWTPNRESLEEVGCETTVDVLNNWNNGEYGVDKMDLD